MVYHGRPSSGCEACRNAKKGCDLEVPCKRCARRNMPCIGRRDPTNLRIKDETRAVGAKFRGRSWSVTSQSLPNGLSPIESAEQKGRRVSSISSGTDSLSNWDSAAFTAAFDAFVTKPNLSDSFRPRVNDIATNYFLLKFTSAVDWGCVRSYVETSTLQPCLDLAIKACGMAAFDNTHHITEGRAYATSLYVDAVRLVNAALRDPATSQDDQSLISVVMLGYYEQLTCEGPQSMEMWRAHMDGATQLLKLRGKEQFNSALGRNLFRNLRGQIISNCFWRQIAPPAFLSEWQDELEGQTGIAPYGYADHLVDICLDFATLRSKIHSSTISDVEAAEKVAEIDDRLIEWSVAAHESDPCWQYSVIEVPDSPYVWNGKIHAYTSPKAPQVWNSWRNIRIMVIQTHEMLHTRLVAKSPCKEKKNGYFRTVLQQMANDICASIPFALGRSDPALSSSCVLMTATTAVWPLFFAGTCVLELENHKRWKQQYFYGDDSNDISDGAGQLEWIQEQFDHIYHVVGIRWAKAVAAPFKRRLGSYHNEMELRMGLGQHLAWLD